MVQYVILYKYHYMQLFMQLHRKKGEKKALL